MKMQSRKLTAYLAAVLVLASAPRHNTFAAALEDISSGSAFFERQLASLSNLNEVLEALGMDAEGSRDGLRKAQDAGPGKPAGPAEAGDWTDAEVMIINGVYRALKEYAASDPRAAALKAEVDAMESRYPWRFDFREYVFTDSEGVLEVGFEPGVSIPAAPGGGFQSVLRYRARLKSSIENLLYTLKPDSPVLKFKDGGRVVDLTEEVRAYLGAQLAEQQRLLEQHQKRLNSEPALKEAIRYVMSRIAGS